MPDRVFVIAEAGVNHNGDVGLAHDLIEAASATGADAVKFQTFVAADLAAPDAEMAAYQKANLGMTTSQAEMLASLELPREAYPELVAHAADAGLEFMSTAFDLDSLRFLVADVGIRRVKIPSGELTNTPFVVECALTGLPLLLSTGMSTLTEVRFAVDAIAYALVSRCRPSRTSDFAGASADATCGDPLRETLTVLHCTSDYPARPEDANLRALVTLRDEFGVPVGYSDHTPGVAVSVAAVALGARVIEKHLTLDRSMAGPDHRASLEADAFTELVRQVRTVESALGSPAKGPVDRERDVIAVARKSLVAARSISRGQLLEPADIVAKRGRPGPSPERYWDLLGTLAADDVAVDEPLPSGP